MEKRACQSFFRQEGAVRRADAPYPEIFHQPPTQAVVRPAPEASIWILLTINTGCFTLTPMKARVCGHL